MLKNEHAHTHSKQKVLNVINVDKETNSTMVVMMENIILTLILVCTHHQNTILVMLHIVYIV